ncbi:hypothetical protein FAZ95_03100 [Trinickia violacea]|uniref:Uncharacterized protein n=1 Tax=Trinickia violacea TaxID=2571746 RepID=A0A4P8IJB7_9BURK|nr:methyl-accepting chemotaxis protein [Trinickia violacea]QCP48266.1 hypothetical protein FAZ95_03100 [Trinickia violacea]
MFSNISLKFKLWLALGLVWLGLISLGTYSAIDAHTRLLDERFAALDNILDVAVNIAGAYRAKAANGEMSPEDAQKATLTQWNLLRYRNNGYVYAATMSQVSLVNPGRPELVGKDASGMTDAKGNHPYADLTALARTEGRGYISAWSKKPGTQDITEKISALRLVPGWDWVVAAGLYVDDVEAAYRAILIGHLAFVLAAGLVSSLVMVLIIRNIERSLGGEPAFAAKVANRIADGDLAFQVKVKAGDQGSLLFAMARMRASLEDVIRQFLESAETISSSASQIAAGNSDLSGRTEQASSSLERTAGRMNELTEAVEQTAGNARAANTLVTNAASLAQQGQQAVEQVVGAMAGIEEASAKIGDISSTIEGISFQTNILSLNAAVEAARAGEQGKGFAVVASEVRTLAHRSATAAKEIKELIDTTVRRVQTGAGHVSKTGEVMSEIVSGVQRVTGIMADIAAASSEQSQGITEVNRSVTEMDGATQQNAALVEEAAAAAAALNEQAQRLREVVAVFRIA